jgi:hypothetical protein
MEIALVRAVHAHLKAYPPASALDVIRAAKLVTKGCHVDAPMIVHVLNIVARGQDGIEGTPDDVIPPDVLKKLRTLLIDDLVEDILVLSSAPGRCCCWR